jgi:hypothetical protein
MVVVKQWRCKRKCSRAMENTRMNLGARALVSSNIRKNAICKSKN